MFTFIQLFYLLTSIIKWLLRITIYLMLCKASVLERIIGWCIVSVCYYCLCVSPYTYLACIVSKHFCIVVFFDQHL